MLVRAGALAATVSAGSGKTAAYVEKPASARARTDVSGCGRRIVSIGRAATRSENVAAEQMRRDTAGAGWAVEPRVWLTFLTRAGVARVGVR